MKRIATLSVLALATGVLLTSVAGVGAGNENHFGLSDPNAPIDISADRLDADQKAMTLVYSGNAVVRQGDVYLHTDTLRVVAAADGKTAEKIFANGHVVVTSATGTATGEEAVYDVDPRLITLTGNVVLTHDDNVMRGKVMKVDLVTGLAKLYGGDAKTDAAGKSTSGGRIQGQFQPRSFKTDKPDDKPAGKAAAPSGGKN